MQQQEGGIQQQEEGIQQQGEGNRQEERTAVGSREGAPQQAVYSWNQAVQGQEPLGLSSQSKPRYYDDVCGADGENGLHSDEDVHKGCSSLCAEYRLADRRSLLAGVCD